ncbi:MAG: guanylate kinase [Opitutales bacterium]|nr:guanylate kinase [Opitutales bacterium]
MRSSGILFIISGPAGVGKTTVVGTLLSHIPSTELQRSITTTTRPPRPDEINGVHYFFISEQEFKDKIRAGDFLEYACVHGHTYYGSSKAEVCSKLSQGINLILVIDVQGYVNILENFHDFRIASIFIKPQTMDTLYTRLLNRGTETMPEIKNRLHTAENELLFANRYKYVINSGTREHDFKQILEIYNKETKALI